MTVRDYLLRARARIERGWTQRAFARRADGTTTHTEHEQACSWCLAGSVGPVFGHARSALIAIEKELNTGTGGIYIWNDAPERTKEEVLAVVDRVLERFPAQEGAAG